jgi:hypothetical protein
MGAAPPSGPSVSATNAMSLLTVMMTTMPAPTSFVAMVCANNRPSLDAAMQMPNAARMEIFAVSNDALVTAVLWSRRFAMTAMLARSTPAIRARVDVDFLPSHVTTTTFAPQTPPAALVPAQHQCPSLVVAPTHRSALVTPMVVMANHSALATSVPIQHPMVVAVTPVAKAVVVGPISFATSTVANNNATLGISGAS